MLAAQVLTVSIDREDGPTLGTGTITTVEGAVAATVVSALDGPTTITEPVGVGRWTVMVMWFVDVEEIVVVDSSCVAVTVASAVSVDVLDIVVREVVTGTGTMVSVMGDTADEEPPPSEKERTADVLSGIGTTVEVKTGAAEVAGWVMVVFEPTGQLVTSVGQAVMV